MYFLVRLFSSLYSDFFSCFSLLGFDIVNLGFLFEGFHLFWANYNTRGACWLQILMKRGFKLLCFGAFSLLEQHQVPRNARFASSVSAVLTYSAISIHYWPTFLQSLQIRRQRYSSTAYSSSEMASKEDHTSEYQYFTCCFQRFHNPFVLCQLIRCYYLTLILFSYSIPASYLHFWFTLAYFSILTRKKIARFTLTFIKYF